MAECKKEIMVINLEDVEPEIVKGGGSVRRIITKERTGMDMTFGRGTLIPGGKHHWHAHTQDEAVFILDGNGTMSVRDKNGERDINYKAGMALFIPAGVEHQNCNNSDKEVNVVSMFNPALK